MDKIAVFIIDRQVLYRQGVRHALSADQGLSVVGECTPGAQTLELVEASEPNVVLLDIDLPFLRGLKIGRLLKTRYPQTSLIVLTSSPNDEQLFESMRAGAAAYLGKNVSAEDLLGVIKRVSTGCERPINDMLAKRPMVAQHLLSHFQHGSLRGKTTEALAIHLTPRETDVLKYIAEDYSSREIPDIMGLTDQIIKDHLASILDKLVANERADAVVLALQQEWGDG